MSLIVEDGSGLSTAESYASVAEADAYHLVHGNPSVWNALSTGEKEQNLRMATDYIDGKFATDFKGYRTYSAQALRWPRSGVADLDGYIFPANGTGSVPVRLKNATAILALRVASDTTLFLDQSNGSVSSESVTVGAVSFSTSYSGAATGQKVYTEVEAMLVDLLGSSNGVMERA